MTKKRSRGWIGDTKKQVRDTFKKKRKRRKKRRM